MENKNYSRRDFLKKVGLVGTLGVGLTGCSTNQEYHFDGEIDGEKIRYYETDAFNCQEHLEVIRKDGTEISYHNRSKGFEVEEVIIIKDGQKFKYSNKRDITQKLVLEEAQKQFDDYLNKIVEYKTQKGLDLIKE